MICRICKGAEFDEIIDLGNQIITSRFPKVGDHTTPTGKICLIMCKNCQLVQLRDTTPSTEMYEHFYGYRSGINATMRNHLASFNQELQSKVDLIAGDSVLDIGSNDCTFLANYPKHVTRYGCDPTGIQFNEFYNDTNTRLIPTYFTRSAIQSIYGDLIRYKAVTSISMFYDLPDPVQFAKDIYAVLDDNGVWALEQSYALTMLEKNSIDTICHEHLEYYGLQQIKNIMDRAGFKIIDVSFNDCNGGSFRIYVSKKDSAIYQENTELIDRILEHENKSGMHTPERYIQFMNDCKTEINKLIDFIRIAKEDHKKTYIYGASTKGNCLLQFANVDSSLIPFAVERNPLKVGRTTSTGIEIISEETMRMDPPAYLLVLPWHFRSEIIKREATFLENGGQFLFPFPTFEIYSSKPKTLITGIDGQIGTYVENELIKTDSVYGIVSQKKSLTSLRISFNLLDQSYLEYIICLLQPDRIVHLASISNTEECEKNPIKTIDTNGRLVANLCDIIYRNRLNCKLFHASSSELYKGHQEYIINDHDESYFPTTMYGISKEMGHRTVDHYRITYGLPFSNGILFMTESKLRSSQFLLKKVALHAKEYKQHNKPIHLGGLDSWRNMNHASDVARAIHMILNQPHGNNYVICSSNFYKVEDVIIDIYKQVNITLEKKDNHFIDIDTNEIVIYIGSSLRNTITKINGNPERLIQMGWKPTYTLPMILNELLE